MNLEKWVFLIFCFCPAWGAPPALSKISTDSLKEYSNIAFRSADRISVEDSLFCQTLIFKNDSPYSRDRSEIISRYSCRDSEVEEFTFIGYQDGFARVLFKPAGSKEPYFGKARIKKSDLLDVYLIASDGGEAMSRMSEKDFEHVSGNVAITTAAVVVVAGLIVSVLVFGAALAASPF